MVVYSLLKKMLIALCDFIRINNKVLTKNQISPSTYATTSYHSYLMPKRIINIKKTYYKHTIDTFSLITIITFPKRSNNQTK